MLTLQVIVRKEKQKLMNTFKKYFFTAVLICFHLQIIHAQQVSIIPVPANMQMREGAYTLSEASTLNVSGNQSAATKVATYFADKVKPATGFNLKINNASLSDNGITLALNAQADNALGAEGYSLDVSAGKIILKANTPAGLFYGVQTLLQLLPKEIESEKQVSNITWKIPGVTITDSPRFAWRGLMLDVSRHFFSKEYVKDYIDNMAKYKFNRFHWHLTDDQGWRVEIKSYPKLTTVGAFRVPRIGGTFGDHEAPKSNEAATDGGFYTRDDIKEIVQYAKDRYIEVLPEIDVPGHSMAALAAYPELCVTKDSTIRVNPGSKFSTWFGNGKFEMNIDNTLNPADEKVYQFLDKIFGEIASLFPFEYIHMGGDECYKGYWERNVRVQDFMKKNNLKNGEELQSYFSKRVSKIIIDKKKKPIGWDEIIEGGLAPGAAVMSWRGTKGGIEAAHQKHPVVMSPAPMYYLDMRQGERSVEPPVYSDARLKDVYAFNILPAEIDSTFVLGGQGNLWTEQIPNPAQADYMVFPRAFAIAETLWSPKYRKNWGDFSKRVENHFERLQAANINYAPSMYDPILSFKKNANNEVVIELATEIKGLDLYYTIDNTVPNQYYPKYKEPIVLPAGVDMFRVISFRDGKPVGRLISLKMEDIEKRIKK
jgi:hexosaminidase